MRPRIGAAAVDLADRHRPLASAGVSTRVVGATNATTDRATARAGPCELQQRQRVLRDGRAPTSARSAARRRSSVGSRPASRAPISVVIEMLRPEGAGEVGQQVQARPGRLRSPRTSWPSDGQQRGGVADGGLADRIERRVVQRRVQRQADPQPARLARRQLGERRAPAAAPRWRRRARSRPARRAPRRCRPPCGSARRRRPGSSAPASGPGRRPGPAPA